jgi:predicted branched-subunit amino acid permease
MTVDQSYVCAMAQYEKEPQMTIPQRMAYFFGCVTPVVPMWYLFTLIGALLGAQIPQSWALDFALPITFLAMIAPMFRTPAHVIAAVVATGAGLLTAGVPYSMGLIIAGLAGMLAGARAELWLDRRAAKRSEGTA